MATIALTIGGAILNATTFVRGSYLAKYLSIDDTDAERERHDKALEKYQRDWAAYQKKKQEFEAWSYQRRKAADQASQSFKTVDAALKYYNESHESSLRLDDDESDFSDYYQPTEDQEKGELIYVGGGMLTLGYLASKWF